MDGDECSDDTGDAGSEAGSETGSDAGSEVGEEALDAYEDDGSDIRNAPFFSEFVGFPRLAFSILEE